MHIEIKSCFISHELTMTFLRLQHLASAFWETIYIIINSELDNEVEEEVFLVYLPSFFIDLSTPKISLIILLTVHHSILMMSIWRIWYWIDE